MAKRQENNYFVMLRELVGYSADAARKLESCLKEFDPARLPAQQMCIRDRTTATGVRVRLLRSAGNPLAGNPPAGGSPISGVASSEMPAIDAAKIAQERAVRALPPSARKTGRLPQSATRDRAK